MALSEKVAHESIAPIPSYPGNQGIPQAPSPQISYPGSPPPAFQQESMSPAAMSAYHSQPMSYQPQVQMAYPPQQAPFNQQGAFPQQPNQQQVFHPQASMQMPPQQMPGQPRQFQNASAIPNLGMGAAPVDCPTCGQRAMTNISYHAGNTTHVWAGITCCLTGFLCFIPYMMNSLKDVQHRCGSCGTLLATWHKSGQVETHIHA